MRKLILASLVLTAILSVGRGRELTDVSLIQVLGVDGWEPVRLTAVGDEEESPRCYQTQAAGVAEAQEALKELGETRLEVTHVAQMVLGPEAQVGETLWQEVRHRKSGYGATVWLTEETEAGDLLRRAADPAKRLKAMEENGDLAAPTVLEALSALTREGRVTLPVLGLAGEELRLVGWRTVEEGR